LRTRFQLSGTVCVLLLIVTVAAAAQDAAPGFSTATLKHGELSLSDLRGKVVLLQFWASWCGTCVEKLPELKRLRANYSEQGFEIVGISIDQEIKAARRTVAEHRLDWPQICDGRGKDSPLAREYEVRGTPRYVLIDRDGLVVREHVRSEDLERELLQILEQ